MKILVDTNILISAIVFGGRPREFLIKLREDGHFLFTSTYIREELRRIFSRKWRKRAEKLYCEYLRLGLHELPSVGNAYGDLRDKNDVPILSDAIAYDMDIILTGDRDFLEARLEHPKAMSVAALSDYLENRSE